MNPWQSMNQMQTLPPPQAPQDAAQYPTFADRYGQPKQQSYEMANPPASATPQPNNPWAGVTPFAQQGEF